LEAPQLFETDGIAGS